MDLWKWADTHRKHVALGVVALALVGVLVGLFFWQQGQKEPAANEALSKVIHQNLTGQIQVQSMDGLVKVATDHPNTGAGQRALLLAGANYFNQGKYEEAKAQFQRSLREYPGTPLSSQAAFGVAVVLEVQGKNNEAMTAYKEVVDRYPNDNVASQARLALGRLNEAAGKLTQARDYYLQIERSEPSQSTIASQASLRLREMFSKHPELVPSFSATTNAPMLELKP